MGRKLPSVEAMMLAMSTLVQSDPVTRDMIGMPRYREPSTRVWTCKKCKQKFRPHKSNAMCDDCIRARDEKYAVSEQEKS